MEKLKKDNHRLRRYKFLKYFVLILLILFIIYNILWITVIRVRNKNLAKWKHTEANNYLYQGAYSYQAHNVEYMRYPANINVSSYKGFAYDISIDGNSVFVMVPEFNDEKKDNGLSKDVTFMVNVDKRHLNNLKYYKIIGSSISDNEVKEILIENKVFKDEYTHVEKIWENVNKIDC